MESAVQSTRRPFGPYSGYSLSSLAIDAPYGSLTAAQKLVKAKQTSDIKQALVLYTSVLDDESIDELYKSRAAVAWSNLYLQSFRAGILQKLFLPKDWESLGTYAYDILKQVTQSVRAPHTDKAAALTLMLTLVDQESHVPLTHKTEKFIHFRKILRDAPFLETLQYADYLKKLVQFIIGRWQRELHYAEDGILACEEALSLKSLSHNTRAGFAYYELCLRVLSGQEDKERERKLCEDILSKESFADSKMYARTYLSILNLRTQLYALEQYKKTSAYSSRIPQAEVKMIQQAMRGLEKARALKAGYPLRALAHFEFARLSLAFILEGVTLDRSLATEIIPSMRWILIDGPVEERNFLNSFMIANTLKEIFVLHERENHPLLRAPDSAQDFYKIFSLPMTIDLFERHNYGKSMDLMRRVLRLKWALELKNHDTALNVALETLGSVLPNVHDLSDELYGGIFQSLIKHAISIKCTNGALGFQMFRTLHDFCEHPLHGSHELFLKTLMVVYAVQFGPPKNVSFDYQLLEWFMTIDKLARDYGLTNFLSHIFFGETEKSTITVLDTEDASCSEIMMPEAIISENKTIGGNDSIISVSKSLEALSLSSEEEGPHKDSTLSAPLLTMPKTEHGLTLDRVSLVPLEGTPSEPSSSSSSSSSDPSASSIDDIYKPWLAYSKAKRVIKVKHVLDNDASQYQSELLAPQSDPKIDRYKERALHLLDRLKHGSKIKDTEVFHVLDRLEYQFQSTQDDHFTWHRNHRSGHNKKGTLGVVVDKNRKKNLRKHLTRAIEHCEGQKPSISGRSHLLKSSPPRQH